MKEIEPSQKYIRHLKVRNFQKLNIYNSKIVLDDLVSSSYIGNNSILNEIDIIDSRDNAS